MVTLLFLLFSLCFTPSYSIIFKGNLYSKNPWKFFAGFSFGKEGNYKISVDAISDSNSDNGYVYLINCQISFNEWDKLISGPYSCQEKTFNTRICGYSAILDKEGYVNNITGKWEISSPIRSREPSVYFIALSHCKYQSTKSSPINLTNYEIELTNGNGLCKHLSMEDQGKLEYNFTFAIIYTILFLVTLYLVWQLHSKEKYHIIFGYLGISILSYFLSYILYSIYYYSFCKKGTSNTTLDIFAYIFEIIGDIFLILHLVLLVKGYRLIRRKIRFTGRLKCIIFCISYFCVDTLAYIYSKTVPSREEQGVTLYDYPMGIMLLVVRGLAFLWFYYSYQVTQNNFHVKKRFFRKLFLWGSIYILSPIIVYLLCLAGAEYKRSIILSIVTSCVTVFAHFGLIILFIPDSPWAYRFPFFSERSSILSTILSLRNNPVNDSHNPANMWKYEIEQRLKMGVQSKSKLEFKISELLTSADRYFTLLKTVATDLDYDIDEPNPIGLNDIGRIDT